MSDGKGALPSTNSAGTEAILRAEQGTSTEHSLILHSSFERSAAGIAETKCQGPHRIRLLFFLSILVSSARILREFMFHETSCITAHKRNLWAVTTRVYWPAWWALLILLHLAAKTYLLRPAYFRILLQPQMTMREKGSSEVKGHRARNLPPYFPESVVSAAETELRLRPFFSLKEDRRTGIFSHRLFWECD